MGSHGFVYHQINTAFVRTEASYQFINRRQMSLCLDFVFKCLYRKHLLFVHKLVTYGVWVSLKIHILYSHLFFQLYSLRTRGRAVNIFDTCVGMLAAMNEFQKVS